MNKVLNFVKLDFITIKPYLTWKNMLILIFVTFVLAYSNDSDSFSMGTTIMFGALYVSYPFAVGEQNGIDALYATLSITRSTVVLGRYLFALTLNICSGLLAYIMNFVLSVVLKRDTNHAEVLMVIVAILAVYTVVQAFQIPMYFKMGHAKAKFAAYLPLAALPLGVIAISSVMNKAGDINALSEVLLWVSENPIIVSIICMVVWVAVMVMSYRISLSFYKKREF